MESLLSALSEGDTGTITRLTLTGPIRRRLQDLGFVPGCRVTAVLRGVNSSIRAYGIYGRVIALRRADAADIVVEQ